MPTSDSRRDARDARARAPARAFRSERGKFDDGIRYVKGGFEWTLTRAIRLANFKTSLSREARIWT